jgi:hypothetical protein
MQQPAGGLTKMAKVEFTTDIEQVHKEGKPFILRCIP